MMSDPGRCQAQVWKRDTYRRTGRTKSGFEMHYNRCQCVRKAKTDGLCAQHAKLAASGVNVLRYHDKWERT